MKSKINILIDNFLKKILEVENSSSNLENKINSINELLDNLIDFCIKKKIYFYIENNIGYNKIVNSFKFHLIKYIQKLIDPSDNLVSKYIKKLNDNLNNYSDINSLLFRKFKAEQQEEQEKQEELEDFDEQESGESVESVEKQKKSKKKNKEPEILDFDEFKENNKKKSVCINEDFNIIGYDNTESFQFNYASDNDSYSKLFPKTFSNVKSILVDNKNNKEKPKKLSKLLNSDEESNSLNSSKTKSESDSESESESDNKNKNNLNQIQTLDEKEYVKNGLFDYEENNKLGLYIKVLLSQNKHLIELIEKLSWMCKIISDPDTVYNKDKPFE